MSDGKRWPPVVRKVLLVLAVLVAARVVLRQFLGAWKLPSASMAPTLLPGDHVFVKRSVQGSALRRGDVIVFRFPEHRDEDFAFRIVALPGQTVELRDSVVLVDGKPLPRCLVGRAKAQFSDPQEGDVFVEWSDGRPYLLFQSVDAAARNFGPFRVPDGQLFVLGDNRHNSRDSAIWFDFKGGGVPFDDVHGRVSSIWSAYESARIGTSLDAPVLPSALSALAPKFSECLQHPPAP